MINTVILCNRLIGKISKNTLEMPGFNISIYGQKMLFQYVLAKFKSGVNHFSNALFLVRTI